MTDASMPLLLDSAMSGMDQPPMPVDLNGVDDLFGDTDALSLPSRLPSRRLRRRLDELRGRGCCQGLAWSKGGTIASITPDGQSLELRYLRANPSDATWELSEAKNIAPWQNLNGGPIVHLSWGPANSELAVIDAVGRVLLLNFNSDLNRPLVSRPWEGDAVDDLHTIVGTYWLNQLPANSRFYPTYSPAIKGAKGTDYTFESSGVPTMGPSHPNPGKSAFICVTTNGLLKMFWSQNNNKPEETTLELESATSADDLITHAAACSDKTKTIYIAMATTSKQLRVVQVAIAFNQPKIENPQNPPLGGYTLTPSLGKRHVAVTSWFQTGMCESPLDASMSKISHIEMLPAHFDIQSKQWSPIVVITVRSFIPEPNSPYNQEVQSIIDRWELLADQKQAVHPAFERLGTRRNSVGSAPPATARLKKLDSIVVNKIVLGVNVLSFGKVILFYYNDGTVEYRDRFTMHELYREVNLSRMHSILEAGFNQSGGPSCLQMAFSPSNYSLVQMYEDWQIKWHNPEYTLVETSTITNDNLSAVIACCAMSTAAAATNNNNNIDDILAVAKKFPRQDQFAIKWVTDLVQVMRISVDYSEDQPHDHLIRNHHLQFCFSIFNHLGWNGEFHERHFRGKLSSLALSIRHTIIIVSLASSAPSSVRANSSPFDEPEVVYALAGCARWSIDFLSWLCNGLFTLLDDMKFMGFLTQTQTNQSQQLVNMTRYLHAKNEIALHLILCSSTRNLISAICRRINLLDNYATRALAWYSGQPKIPDGVGSRHIALYAAYRKVHRYTSSALVKADEFDKFIAVLAGDIRSAYATSLSPLEAQKVAKNPPPQNQTPNAPKPDRVKEARQHCELNMLLVLSPPPSFLAVITKLFRQDLTNFRANVDIAKLYFADYHLLEIVDTPEALANRRKRGTKVDMFRRVEISKQAQVSWRRCSRCGNTMEDLTSANNKAGMMFLLTQQRTCCCGGRLALLP